MLTGVNFIQMWVAVVTVMLMLGGALVLLLGSVQGAIAQAWNMAVLFFAPLIPRHKEYLTPPTKPARRLMQGISAFMAVFAIAATLNQAESLMRDHEQFIASGIVALDFYESHACSNLQKDDRVNYISESRVNVASKSAGGWTFSVRDCNRNSSEG